MPRFRPDLEAIPRYVPGKPIDEVSREMGLSDIVKLASNENPTAPFDEVTDAIASAATEVHRYPEDSGYHLTNALSHHLDVPTDHVWLGAGSTQLIRSISSAVGGPGTSVVYGWPSFIGYRITAAMAGSASIEVPLDNDGRHDLDAMQAAITPNTTLVYVCNPNNPTGTTVSDASLSEFVRLVPQDVLVVIDEAYFEYVTASDYATQIPAAITKPNVLVARTFSKIYGLAGLRVGYAIGNPRLLGSLRKTQLPFVVNSVGQAAALASLRLAHRLSERVETNTRDRSYLEEAFRERSLDYFASQTNFVAFRPPYDPKRFSEQLLAVGVIVRPLGSLVRVTVGLPSENKRFVAALDEILASAIDDDENQS